MGIAAQTAPFSFAAPIGREAFDTLAKWLIYSQIISATFLQKIALPLGPGAQVFLAMIIMLGAAGLGVLTKRLEIHSTRFALYLFLAGGATLLQLLRGGDFSLTSLGLLLLIHLPYILRLREGSIAAGTELAFFRKVMIIIAIIGIAQFCLQFVIGVKYAYYLDDIFPQEWVAKGYNQMIPLHFGSHIYKSNGFFMLEPSMFSQFLALGLVTEMAYFKRLPVIMLFSAAFFTTFSGTGLIILAIVVPSYLIRQRRYVLLISVALTLGLIVAAAPLIGLKDYVGRASEFSEKGSSGYARFLSMFPTLHDFILPQTDTVLMGRGAGSFKYVGEHVSYAWHDPSWGKIFFEYGIIGMFLYFPLLFHVFATAPKSRYIKMGLMIQFLFLAEYVLSPTVHNLIIGLLAWPVTDFSPDPTSGTEKNST